MRVLLLNQCFYPDVVSTAQHLTDLTLGLVERGHQVTVVASRRGYDDPSKRFLARESWRGIEIIRIPSLGFGKVGRFWRCADFAGYLLICFLRLMLLPRHDLTVGLTSPPLISFLGALFARLRGGRFYFWVMDLNPDEGIELGWVRQESVIAHVLQTLLQYSLRRSDRIIALDRFMRERIIAKGIPADRIAVLPPWSHDHEIRYNEAGRAAFRAAHGLTRKFVVMYSGNHSACHPLDTLLQAAQKLRADERIVLCFVGGGSEFQKVKDFARTNALANILCLPYQPLNQLAGSLSAADLHVVVMGDRFPGLVHPCKVYNIVAIGAPFLYIGPAESHVSDLMQQYPDRIKAGSLRHGDIEGVVAHIREAAGAATSRILPPVELTSLFSSKALIPRMMSILEQPFENGAAVPRAELAIRKPPQSPQTETRL